MFSYQNNQDSLSQNKILSEVKLCAQKHNNFKRRKFIIYKLRYLFIRDKCHALSPLASNRPTLQPSSYPKIRAAAIRSKPSRAKIPLKNFQEIFGALAHFEDFNVSRSIFYPIQTHFLSLLSGVTNMLVTGSMYPIFQVPYYGESGLNAGVMLMDLNRMKRLPGGWTGKE